MRCWDDLRLIIELNPRAPIEGRLHSSSIAESMVHTRAIQSPRHPIITRSGVTTRGRQDGPYSERMRLCMQASRRLLLLSAQPLETACLIVVCEGKSSEGIEQFESGAQKRGARYAAIHAHLAAEEGAEAGGTCVRAGVTGAEAGTGVAATVAAGAGEAEEELAKSTGGLGAGQAQ